MDTTEKTQIETEPVNPRQLNIVKNMLGYDALFFDFNNIDYTRGRGLLEDGDKCVWTKDGKRITFVLGNMGGLHAIQSQEPDPDIPPAQYEVQ